MKKEELAKMFSLPIRKILERLEVDAEEVQEIRLRVQCPLLITWQGREYFVTESGRLTIDEKLAYIVDKREVVETLEYMANYSMYAFEEELKQGFITVQGGHRVGVAGKIVMEAGKIQSVKYISFLNIRLSHQIKGLYKIDFRSKSAVSNPAKVLSSHIAAAR